MSTLPLKADMCGALAETELRVGSSAPRETRDQPCLEPAPAGVPAATKQQNEDQNNDEKRSGVHVCRRVLYFGALRTIHSNFN